jgi:hypothetical protein
MLAGFSTYKAGLSDIATKVLSDQHILGSEENNF